MRTSMQININKLKESNDFLNIVLDNIETAVFIVDENLKIYQFNDSFLSLFNKMGSNLVDVTFGPASGCINSIRENKPCGETSACANCILKRSLLNTLSDDTPNGKKSFERIFYTNGIPQKKYLEFISRPITFEDRSMILVFIYDITESEQSKKELKEQRNQINNDLKKAGEIQKSLLPKPLPEIPYIKTAWSFEPSINIGGDIFHLYKENDRFISMYMLDVCGHGVAAALIAVTVKQFIDKLYVQGLARKQFFGPAEILNELEKEFPFDRFDCYFTIVYIQLNFKTGELLYGCAGHVPPVVLCKDGSVKELDLHDTIVGLGIDLPYKQYRSQLDPGDKIILYTDGLIDYFGDRGDIVNKDNFYKTLSQLKEKSVQNLTMGLRKRQKELCTSDQSDDDISILIVEYVGL